MHTYLIKQRIMSSAVQKPFIYRHCILDNVHKRYIIVMRKKNKFRAWQNVQRPNVNSNVIYSSFSHGQYLFGVESRNWAEIQLMFSRMLVFISNSARGKASAVTWRSPACLIAGVFENSNTQSQAGFTTSREEPPSEHVSCGSIAQFQNEFRARWTLKLAFDSEDYMTLW